MSENLKTIRILQIGDVHFPDGMAQAGSADVKDDGVAESLTHEISSASFIESVRRLTDIIENERINSIAFMGDLTSLGDLKQYEACVNFFSGLLRLGDAPMIDPRNVIVVAGNHDVCREICKTTPMTKFSVLSDYLKAGGFKKLSEQNLDIRNIAEGESFASLIGLNSCMGCGEKRFLPQRVRDEIYEKIDKDLSNVDDKEKLKVLDEVYEQLDAPAVSSDSIGFLIESVEKLDRNSIPVVIAHHNLLPQSLPRLAPYTELVNSGALRSTLTSLSRPVIYLHGHIHTDPIEVITNAVKGKSPLISISAPCLDSGFNIIEIGFGSRGDPIGCRVLPYRINASGYIMKQESTLIPFSGFPRAYLDPIRSDLLSKIIDAKYIPFSDLVHWAKSREWFIDNTALTDDLIELSWHGVIVIEGTEHDEQFWRIRSSVS